MKQLNRSLNKSFRYYSRFQKVSDNSSIISFADLKPLISNEMNTYKNNNVVILKSLPKIGHLINGFRQNELSIYSGPTGSGKTTSLIQLSLDYCIQGIKTLWGSFEMKNTKIGHIIIKQISQERDSLSDQFKDLQLYFMNFFGSTPMDLVIKTMYESYYSVGIQHIVLDNLQFMLSEQYSSRIDKFDVSDKCISKIRSFCNETGVHVTLVVHPRKEDDNTPLGISSISGSAKVSQEADNIFILQKLSGKTFFEIKKNRHEGTLGNVELGFDRNRKLFVEIGEIRDQLPSVQLFKRQFDH